MRERSIGGRGGPFPKKFSPKTTVYKSCKPFYLKKKEKNLVIQKKNFPIVGRTKILAQRMVFRNKGQNRLKYLFRYLSPFFGNETSKCSHWREKRPKGRGFSHPISSKIILGKESKAKIERARRKKGGKEEKNNGWSPSFYLLATFDIGFWVKKKKLDGRGLFGGSVLKNPVLLLRRNDSLFTDLLFSLQSPAR